MGKHLSSDHITIQDALKAFAVIIMVIDHIGGYFFHDALWYRAVGRIGFPIWFFLVGYSQGRGISRSLKIGAALLVAGDIIFGRSLFPLNALATIACIRLTIDRVMGFALRSKKIFWTLSTLMFLMFIPSGALLEYGTLAWLLAMFGWVIRHKEKPEVKAIVPLEIFTIFCFFAFVGMMMILQPFSSAQVLFMGVGTLAVMAVLHGFTPVSWPMPRAALGRLGGRAVQYMGRYTLEIYVAHLLLFKMLLVLLNQKILFGVTIF